MDPFDHLKQNSHHVVAIYADASHAEKAIDTLRASGVPDKHFSILIRSGDEQPPSDHNDEKTRDVMTGTAAGGAIGFLLGAIAFGIPGIGEVIGAGLWTATIIGAALGATAGIETSDYHHAWEGPYQAAITQGNTLVAVSTDDALTAAHAIEEFQATGAVQIDQFDRHGTAL